MHDIREPANMYDPYSFYPYNRPFSYEEEFNKDEFYDELEEDFLDLEDFYYYK